MNKEESIEITDFVCFYGVFRPIPFGDITINFEGFQILTYARHSWY